jgi:hypothetical protein
LGAPLIGVDDTFSAVDFTEGFDKRIEGDQSTEDQSFKHSLKSTISI